MTGPIDLLRKNSKKLKKKLSKQEKLHGELDGPPTTKSTGNYHGMSTPRMNRNTVSFDLSPADYSPDEEGDEDKWSSSTHSNFYNINHFHSVQNLPSYGRSDSNLLLDHPNNKENHTDTRRSNSCRKSIDSLGTLIRVPKRRPMLPLDLNSKRKSFDFATYQHAKAHNRVFSDSSVYSKTRPQSLILDHDSNYTQPYRIHRNTASNNAGDRSASSDIKNHGRNGPNNTTGNFPYNRNSGFSKSSTSLNTVMDTSILTLDRHPNHPENPNGRSHLGIQDFRALPRIDDDNDSNFDNRSLHHLTFDTVNSLNPQKDHLRRSNSSRHAGSKHHRKHRHHTHRRSEENNQGVVLPHPESWSPERVGDIIFAIVFHTLNIIFGVFVYLPLYIIFKLGYLSIAVIMIIAYIWYTNSWPSIPNTAINTVLKIESAT